MKKIIIGLVALVLFSGCEVSTNQIVDISCEKGEVFLKIYTSFNKTDDNLRFSGFYEDEDGGMKCEKK